MFSRPPILNNSLGRAPNSLELPEGWIGLSLGRFAGYNPSMWDAEISNGASEACAMLGQILGPKDYLDRRFAELTPMATPVY